MCKWENEKMRKCANVQMGNADFALFVKLFKYSLNISSVRLMIRQGVAIAVSGMWNLLKKHLTNAIQVKNRILVDIVEIAFPFAHLHICTSARTSAHLNLTE